KKTLTTENTDVTEDRNKKRLVLFKPVFHIHLFSVSSVFSVVKFGKKWKKDY
ncbi:MAG: hypothetical protein H6Q43_2529, partial [Deltaproteobacteria bacterium]|nr:hypothetical protein [Deltaproteobacteria bacterium]